MMKSPLPAARATAPRNSSDAMHGGMEIALTVLLFVLVGLALDSWLETGPWFVIVLFLFAAIASGLRLYFSYNHEMEQLEAQRAELASRKRGAA